MKTYQYQPGNGCNYDLVYAKYPGLNRYLLAWLHKGGSGGSSFSFHGDSYITAGYLMEKMGLHHAGHAQALLGFLAEQGHEVEQPSD